MPGLLGLEWLTGPGLACVVEGQLANTELTGISGPNPLEGLPWPSYGFFSGPGGLGRAFGGLFGALPASVRFLLSVPAVAGTLMGPVASNRLDEYFPTWLVAGGWSR